MKLAGRVADRRLAGVLGTGTFAEPAEGVPPSGSARASRPVVAETRIETHYQPIVRMADGVPVGLEVLARVAHPTRGTIMPDLFMPHVERAGLSMQLTMAVVRRAFADWSGGGLDELGLTLALNLPLDVLVGSATPTWIEAQRALAGIRAEQLVIELTESLPVEHLPELDTAISGLRALGYGVALDDVGPDGRHYSDLFDLPFTSMKLDKALVVGSRDSVSAQEFLSRAVLDAHVAGLTIVAEGVADSDAWTRMRTLGVEQAQGFLVAHPLAKADVAPWCRDWRSRHAP